MKQLATYKAVTGDTSPVVIGVEFNPNLELVTDHPVETGGKVRINGIQTEFWQVADVHSMPDLRTLKQVYVAQITPIKQEAFNG